MVGRPFQKGQSGNPNGRPKDKYGLKEQAMQLGPEAIATLNAIMNDGQAPPNARVSAACAILDRGYGKPDQHSTVDVNKHDATDWSSAELVAFIAEARASLGRVGKANGSSDKPGQVH